MRHFINLVEEYADYDLTQGILETIPQETLDNLARQGFNTSFPLYHGSDQVLTKLDREFVRTASHIYTSPDPATAGAYGKHLYLVFGKTNPTADLIEDYRLIGKIAKSLAPNYLDYVDSDEDLEAFQNEIAQEIMDDPDFNKDEYYDISDAMDDAKDDPRYKTLQLNKTAEYIGDMITGGQLYDVSSTMQDLILDECFGEGYKCVIFADPASSDGGEWISAVFESNDDVAIIKQVR